MNTIINVSSTSISGVTLICGPDGPPPAMENDIGTRSSQARACLQHQTPYGPPEFLTRALSFRAKRNLCNLPAPRCGDVAFRHGHRASWTHGRVSPEAAPRTT